MPCTSLNEASCCRNSLLSTGLVGSWFLSCASISVRKSVPPRLAPLTPVLELVSLELPVLPVLPVEPVDPAEPVPVPAPVELVDE